MEGMGFFQVFVHNLMQGFKSQQKKHAELALVF